MNFLSFAAYSLDANIPDVFFIYLST